MYWIVYIIVRGALRCSREHDHVTIFVCIRFIDCFSLCTPLYLCFSLSDAVFRVELS